MNSGIQDAHNLAWKLAAAVTNPTADADALLESYSKERTSLITRRVQPVTDLADDSKPHDHTAVWPWSAPSTRCSDSATPPAP
jgi:2-polyprenyl-6-methoxyphenol hydroxylase-like FAD-dependent oxidoreductase